MSVKPEHDIRIQLVHRFVVGTKRSQVLSTPRLPTLLVSSVFEHFNTSFYGLDEFSVGTLELKLRSDNAASLSKLACPSCVCQCHRLS
jgi:hypothetical protein